MPGATTKYALPFPVGSDTPDVPRDMSALANAVDGIFLGSDSVTPAATRIISNKLLTADTQPAFKIMGDGTISWGPGGSTAPALTLSRGGNTFLSLNGAFFATNFGVSGASAGGYAFTSWVGAEAQDRFELLVSGQMQWGPGGTTAPDVFMARVAANQIGVKAADFVVSDAAAGVAATSANNLIDLGLGNGHYPWIYLKSADGGATGGYGAGIEFTAGTATPATDWYIYTQVLNPGLRIGNTPGDQYELSASGFTLMNNQKIQWASAPASAADTNLYRSGVGILTTDGQLVVTPKLGYIPGLLINAFGNGAQHFLQMKTAAANFPFLIIDNTGSLLWGPGDATNNTDTSLARTSAGILSVGGILAGSSDIIASWGGAYQMRFAGVAGNPGILFGPSQDIGLYRRDGNGLETDHAFSAKGAMVVGRQAGQDNSPIYFGSALDTSIYRDSAGVLRTDNLLYLHRAASTDVVQQIGYGASLYYFQNAAGGMNWGNGASFDTTLYRTAAGALKTDGSFSAAIIYIPTNGSAGTAAFASSATGDTNYRFIIGNDGTFRWGPGNAASDTALYRTAAGVLKTDGALVQTNIGTSFPSSPVDGQEYNYVADSANGVIWKFIYSTSTGKWRFAGGSPLSASAGVGGSAETTTSTTFTDLTTPGPSIVLPFTGDYDITVQSRAGTSAGDSQRTGFQIGATAAAVNESACTSMPSGGGASVANESCSVTWRKTGISGTVTAKYRSGTGGTASYTDRWLYIKPVQK